MNKLYIVMLLILSVSCTTIVQEKPVYKEAFMEIKENINAISLNDKSYKWKFDNLETKIDTLVDKYKYEISDYDAGDFDTLHIYLYLKKAYFYKILKNQKKAMENLDQAYIYILSQRFVRIYKDRLHDKIDIRIDDKIFDDIKKELDLYSYENIESIMESYLKEYEKEK